MKYTFWLASFMLLLLSCKTKQDVIYSDGSYELVIEEMTLDTLTVTASRTVEEVDRSLPVYHSSYTRNHDLLHTELYISFDWKARSVIGVANLQFAPLKPAEFIILHAQNFAINEIKLNGRVIENYSYDGNELKLDLGKKYGRGEKFDIDIDYVAYPHKGKAGGGVAITSNQGLFFINPDGTDPHKPQQIWTQGETENNSRWFPTIDKPNERCTQEIYLTVQDKFKTLSNGKFVSSTRRPDGTRTDHWKQDLPHAPYLFMIAVGEFHIEKEEWKKKPVLYYVEKDYAPDAKDIFAHTPEMLDYFSELLDYEYPWDKYAQVVVRDFVSGAMENTTAVIFGDFVQKTKRELIDNHNDLIVAHEMFHHWFGDLVTCESWSNLTMNEGFANYAEYLWLEKKYGTDYAEAHRLNELSAYIQSALSQGTHELIDFDYADKDDMFDAHSYNKGGLVLHMLRDYLGDEIFFLGLQHFLKQHAYSDVEAHELRLAMEDVSGEDLNWFFNQWYFTSGHPELEINYTYDEIEKSLNIEINQIQDHETSASIFQIAFNAKIYHADNSIQEVPVMLNQRSQTVILDKIPSAPHAVVLDGNHIFLGIKKELRDSNEWIYLFKNSDAYQDKYEALRFLKNKSAFDEILPEALNEKHHVFRGLAAEKIFDQDKLLELVKNDPHSTVRRKALIRLYEMNEALALKTSNELLDRELAYPVLMVALEIIASFDIEDAAEKVVEMSRNNATPFHDIMFDIFAGTGDPGYLKYFEAEMPHIGVYQVFNFYAQFRELAFKASPDRILQIADHLERQSLNQTAREFNKYLSTFTMNALRQNLDSRLENEQELETINAINKASSEIKKRLVQIIESEQDANLRARYSSLDLN